MTLFINNEQEFEGTEMECMDYANNQYSLTDEQFSDLQYDGSTVINGTLLELYDETA